VGKKNEIKVGFCVAYDWYLLEYAIPLIYESADCICLSIDKDRISWSGESYSWNEVGFRELVARIDKDAKIEVLEEDYHLPELQPMQNEVRQRNSIAAYLGAGGWHVQLDADEFFLNFSGFVKYLKGLKPHRKINVVCPWITLYKQDTDGFFYVDFDRFDEVEFMQIATKWPQYEYGRRNKNFNIYTDFCILHLSWARAEKEILEKLNNWGHRNDFDISEYFQQWKQLSKNNYTTYKNFHHIHPGAWPKIGFIAVKDLPSLLEIADRQIRLPITSLNMLLRNNIWVSRIKALLQKVSV
jgi:hypothetical protein